MSARHLRAGLIACALTLLVLAYAYQQHRKQARHTTYRPSANQADNNLARPMPGSRQSPADQATYQQVLKNTMTLCGVLAPTAGEVNLTAEPRESRAPGGIRLRTWYVMCEDRGGNYLAHFIWDADTRQLLWVGCRVKQPHVGLLAQTSAESVRTARWWLAALGISRWGTRWQQVRAPIQEGDAWCVSLRSPEQEATVTVDRRSGSLNYVHCSRARSADAHGKG